MICASIRSMMIEKSIAAQNFARFQDAMYKKKCIVHDAPRDGNCFYWSLSDQMSQQHTHQELRHMLVAYMKALSEVCAFITNHGGFAR